MNVISFLFEGGGGKSRSVYFALAEYKFQPLTIPPTLLLQSITKILNYGNTDDDDETSYAIIPQNVVNKLSSYLEIVHASYILKYTCVTCNRSC